MDDEASFNQGEWKMRKEILLCIGLVASLLVSAAAANVRMVYAATPTIYVDPSTITTSPSRSFTVSLKVADVTDLFLWNITIFWSTGLFNFVSAAEGNFLRTGGSTWFSVIGPWTVGSPSRYALDVGCYAGGRYVSGSGTLATLTFVCVGAGETSIDISQGYLYDNPYQPMYPCNRVNGYVYSDQPLGPVASFTQSSVTAFTDDPVSFDASSSLPGWSGTVDMPIVNYAWDFESDGLVDAYGVTVTHGFPSAGNYGITLNVTDSQELWNTDSHPTEIIYRAHASVDIAPDSLNLKSMGKWITCYIELPTGYSVSDITVSSILLNDTIPVDPLAPTTIGDYDNNGIPDLMVKFSRPGVISYVFITQPAQKAFITTTFTITGNLNDGTTFQGSTTVRIILPDARGKNAMIQS